MARTAVTRAHVNRTPKTGGGGGGGPTAPVISGVTADPVTTTTARISWTLDQPGTGWVEYGTTTGYGQETTHETSFDYSAHVQAISGLTPNILYHYKCHSVNAAAQAGTDTDHTFTTLTSASRPAILSVITFAPPSTSLVKPTYLGTITDPTFGVPIKRISNVNLRRNHHVNQTSFSLGNKWLVFYPEEGGSATNLRLLDGTTFVDQGQFSNFSMRGANRLQFSNTDEDLIYGMEQYDVNNGLGWLDLGEAGVASPWHRHITQITGGPANRTYPYIFWQNALSMADDLIAVTCNESETAGGSGWPNSAAYMLFAIDPRDGAIQGYVDIQAFLTSIGQSTWPADTRHGQVTISLQPDPVTGKRYMHLDNSWGGSIRPCYVWQLPDTPGNTACTPMTGGSYGANGLSIATGSHQETALQVDGTPGMVTGGGNGRFIRFRDNVSFDLWPGVVPAFENDVHYGFGNKSYWGWATVSSGVGSGSPGHDQVGAINLDGSGQWMPFAHGHNVCDRASNGGWDTPYAIANRDLTRMVWGSPWHAAEGTATFCYAAGVGLT